MKYDIFISYRREGGYDTAKHLNDLLVRDGYKVSFDIDTLRDGDFDTQLLTRIEQCKDFILIVDKHAFDRTLDPTFDPQKDWLRCELAHALKHRKNIVPIFLSGVNGFPNGLPADIAGVVKKNGPEYNRYHFNAFYKDLKRRFLKSRSRYLLYLLLGLVLFLLSICVFNIENVGEGGQVQIIDNDSIQIQKKNVKVEYYGKNTTLAFNNELYAKVDGYDYKIELKEDICFEILAQDDFDGDGVTDALIKNIEACGGNAYGNSFFFVSYNGGGFFSISQSFGDNVWEDPKIEDWNGKKSVVVINTNEGFNTEKDYVAKERYIYQQGEPVRVEFSKKNSIAALKEVLPSAFHNGNELETIRMSFDLDQNGQEDVFECRYWDRWDKLYFDIIFNGTPLDCGGCGGVSRIAVASTKTNGVHDLICNEDDVVKWNGSTYAFDETFK